MQDKNSIPFNAPPSRLSGVNRIEHRTIIQEDWDLSPCRTCSGSPCCFHLPLTSIRLETRTDFLNLALLSCYHHIRLGLKNSGEWHIYYHKDCRFLDPISSQCRIHGAETQSLICKTYNAHACWYRQAFDSDQNERLILFDLHRLLQREKKIEFLKTGYIHNTTEWDELVHFFSSLPMDTGETINKMKLDFKGNILAFKKNNPERFLFFPPFEKPKRDAHFELYTFRLGFPGVSLALSDNYWTHMVHTRINKRLFKQLALTYFPTLKAEHGCFSFYQLHKTKWFYSDIGERWVIVHHEHLDQVKEITEFDSSGYITRLPGTGEILSIIRPLKPRTPDKAA
jgi:hypothetical protein